MIYKHQIFTITIIEIIILDHKHQIFIITIIEIIILDRVVWHNNCIKVVSDSLPTVTLS